MLFSSNSPHLRPEAKEKQSFPVGWLCLISSNHGPQSKARLRHMATDSPFALFVVWFSYKNHKFKVAKKAQIVQSEDGTKREISLISNYNLHLSWPTHQTSWPPCLGSSLLIHLALFYRGHILSLLEVTMPFYLKKDRIQSENPCRELWSIHWKGQRKATMAAKQNGTAASPPPHSFFGPHILYMPMARWCGHIKELSEPPCCLL